MKTSAEGKGLATSTVKVGRVGSPSLIGFMGLVSQVRKDHRKRKRRSRVYRLSLLAGGLCNRPLDTTKNRFYDAYSPVSQDGRNKECIAR